MLFSNMNWNRSWVTTDLKTRLKWSFGEALTKWECIFPSSKPQSTDKGASWTIELFFNSKTIVFIQEPYTDVKNHRVLGFNMQLRNVYYHNKGMKTRTCIIATKNVSLILLPQHCDGDTATVLFTSTDEFILSSLSMQHSKDEHQNRFLNFSPEKKHFVTKLI